MCGAVLLLGCRQLESQNVRAFHDLAQARSTGGFCDNPAHPCAWGYPISLRRTSHGCRITCGYQGCYRSCDNCPYPSCSSHTTSCPLPPPPFPPPTQTTTHHSHTSVSVCMLDLHYLSFAGATPEVASPVLSHLAASANARLVNFFDRPLLLRALRIVTRQAGTGAAG